MGTQKKLVRRWNFLFWRLQCDIFFAQEIRGSVGASLPETTFFLFFFRIIQLKVKAQKLSKTRVESTRYICSEIQIFINKVKKRTLRSWNFREIVLKLLKLTFSFLFDQRLQQETRPSNQHKVYWGTAHFDLGEAPFQSVVGRTPDICQFWYATALFRPVKVHQDVGNFAAK